MGVGSAPAITPPVVDPSVLAMMQSAQQTDLSQTQSDLSGQTSAMARMFGAGSILKPSGAVQSGAVNGLSSVAFAPLGMGR